MDRWVGKVAIVTGSSSGIGAAIAVDLANAGMVVVGLARRVERVEELKLKVSSKIGALHAFKCDITSEDDIKTAFKWTIKKFGGVDVLVNNAGILRMGNLIDNDNTTMIREGTVFILTGSLNMYPAAKFAVTAITEVLRQEFNREGTKIKVTSISPGGVRTEIVGTTPEIIEASKSWTLLDSEDVSQAVLFVLATRPHVQIHQLTLKPLGESF